jgi:hypothetical protein
LCHRLLTCHPLCHLGLPRAITALSWLIEDRWSCGTAWGLGTGKGLVPILLSPWCRGERPVDRPTAVPVSPVMHCCLSMSSWSELFHCARGQRGEATGRKAAPLGGDSRPPTPACPRPAIRKDLSHMFFLTQVQLLLERREEPTLGRPLALLGTPSISALLPCLLLPTEIHGSPPWAQVTSIPEGQ